jgi:hypothetical protein
MKSGLVLFLIICGAWVFRRPIHIVFGRMMMKVLFILLRRGLALMGVSISVKMKIWHRQGTFKTWNAPMDFV